MGDRNGLFALNECEGVAKPQAVAVRGWRGCERQKQGARSPLPVRGRRAAAVALSSGHEAHLRVLRVPGG